MKQIKETKFHEHFRVTGTHVAILDYSDLLGKTLQGDDVERFDSRWDEVLLSIQRAPSDDILESLKKICIHGSDHLKTVLTLLRPELNESRQEHQRKPKGNLSAQKGSKESVSMESRRM